MGSMRDAMMHDVAPSDDVASGYHRSSFSMEYPFNTIFPFWEVQNGADLFASCACLFAFGMGHEFVKYLQIQFDKRGFDMFNVKKRNKQQMNEDSQPKNTRKKENEKIPEDEFEQNSATPSQHSKGEKLTNPSNNVVEKNQKNIPQHSRCSLLIKHLLSTLTHVIALMWTYILMLSVMTYNPVIVCSAVCGCTVGYFLFHTPSRDETTLKIYSRVGGIEQELNSTAV